MTTILRTKHGTKDWQTENERCEKCGDYVDRALEYRKWRMQQNPHDGYAVDLDQIEWACGSDGRAWPVAILELTRRDPHRLHPDPPESYFTKTLRNKTVGRDWGQTRMQVRLAQTLGLPLYLVAYKQELNGFYVHDMLNRKGFSRKLSPEEYTKWLYSLRDKVTPGNCVLTPGESVYNEPPFCDLRR
jgi:hypothetical protein